MTILGGGGLNVTYGITAGTITANGSALTNLTGANIVTGIPSSVLPSTVAYTNATQTWTAGQTFGASGSSITVVSGSSLTLNGILMASGSAGSSGNVLQSNGNGAVPTWVTPASASALLSTNNLWTAPQTFGSSITVTAPLGAGVTFGVVAGSFTGNGSAITSMTGANIITGIPSTVLPSTVADRKS